MYCQGNHPAVQLDQKAGSISIIRMRLTTAQQQQQQTHCNRLERILPATKGTTQLLSLQIWNCCLQTAGSSPTLPPAPTKPATNPVDRLDTKGTTPNDSPALCWHVTDSSTSTAMVAGRLLLTRPSTIHIRPVQEKGAPMHAQHISC
jgi:hypothetical protein